VNRFRRAAVLALAVAVVTAACARDEERPGPAAASPEAADPEFINGGDCPASRHDDLPAGAGCVSTVGKGDETLRVYAVLDDEAKPRAWRLRLDGGERDVDQRLRAGNVASYPRAVGVTDLNDDGVPEWWVKTADYASHGAPWAGLSLFVPDGSSLARVRYEGEPFTVNFGGISRLGEGAACRDGLLVTLRAWTLDRQNRHWKVSERRFRLEGATVHLVDKQRRSLDVESYTDPDLQRNYRVECDGATFTTFG
jgi:hypothetical protein